MVIDDFPKYINSAIEEVSNEKKIQIKKETHYDAINRVLEWFGENKLYRLDITYLHEKSCIKVICYVDEFQYPKSFYKILNWCHNYIPNFPYLVKTKWKDFGDIPLKLAKEEYKNIFRSHIESVNKGELSFNQT